MSVRRAVTCLFVVRVAGVSVRGLVGFGWQYGASDRVVFRIQIGAESCRFARQDSARLVGLIGISA